MGSEEGDGMASVDAAASWQQYYTWCGPYSHPHSHSHPHSPATGQPHTHSHPHYHHPNHLNQYQTPGQYQQQSLAASTANASAHYSTSQQYHMQLQPAQTPPLHQQHQFHPVKGQTAPRRAAPYDRTGKQGKDGPEEKKDADGELWGNVEAQAAFLGPNLWDKTLPYDADLKVLNHYVDLDEFLSENGIPVDGVAGGGQGTMQSGQLHKINNTETPGHQGPAGLHLEPVTKRERSPSPSECCSPDTMNPPSPADSNSEDSSRIQYGLSLVALSMASSGRDFDPRTRAFSDEELKPQPMIKKSRKQFVPDDLKDDKYWARRRKNNMAAKRSRDARRMKENQIALRAGFLEKENMGLRQELDRLKNENMLLRDKLSKYTDV
ncbi:thyrotroph embryonic factor isoform X3 [Bombus affinis]|uniref:Thyrotroph embryonic factor isoform X3 n=1 Tax=Bombus terrestris TaxID=30195 RepID=A0A9C6SFA7_BOMTE|nr:thyrotroph embryonic factor isoform X3 [Bombus terrestris]XP_050592630.1 thyrotroph embryonic factor isoform X3 [Bombus affinis]XP_060828325.1 thyrotroph embryonic factor isoform X3 [Bombus pascuorum]